MDLDPRVIKVSLEINGKLTTYEKLSMFISGTKYANANQNDCEVKIINLNKETRNRLLTETTPFNLNRTPKKVIIEAGRESYGTARIFVGDITRSHVTQPPDIAVTLSCLTGDFQKGNVISTNLPSVSKLKQVAQNAANALGIPLKFEADNKDVKNYTYSGSALKQIDKLNALGVNAFLDDTVLNVKNPRSALKGTTRVLDSMNGLIGIPEITELGVRVKFLLDNITRIGSLLKLKSEVNPAANGDYVVFKLGFEIATRDTAFYYIAEAMRT